MIEIIKINDHHIAPNIKLVLRNFLFLIMSLYIIIFLNNTTASANSINEKLEFSEACISAIKKTRPQFEAREKFIDIKARSDFRNYYNIFLNSKKTQLIYCLEGYKKFLESDKNLPEFLSNVMVFAQAIINEVFKRGIKKLKGHETHSFFIFNSELGKSNNSRICRFLIGSGDPLVAMNSDFLIKMNLAQSSVDPDAQANYYKLAAKAILKEVEESPNIPSLSGYEAVQLERDFEKFLIPYFQQIVADHPEKNDYELYSDIANVLSGKPAKFEETYCHITRQYFRALADMPGFSGDKIRELFVARYL